MSNRKSKKAVAIVTSLSMMANASPQIKAINQIAIPQRIQNAFPPTFTNPLQPISNDFSIKSIEEKINNVLNPVEKEESKEAKLLVDDASGDCGDGVTYTFTASTGELVISYKGSGTGAMTSYSFFSSAPWFSYRESIKSLVIENGVTSIGYGAFFGCSGLTSITIPFSVTSIGSSAFSGCSGLTSITIPSSVTEIGEEAFSGCSGLTSINVDENNTKYKSFEGILYSYDGKTLIQCPGGKTGEVTIPSSVASIGDYAFYGCSGLTGQLTIPSSVTEIGSFAFYGCSGLTGQLTIPSSVTSIGSSAFRNCSGLTGQLTIPSSVTSIGSYAFSGCSGLTSINIDENNTSYKSIEGILYSKDGKTLIQCPGGKTGSITIPASVTSIGEEAFSGCSGLTSITIPSSVTSIGDYAFYGCSGLTSVTYTGITAPTFGEKVFDNCHQLTEVSVPYNYQGESFGESKINRMPEQTSASTKGNSKTALIASTVSAAVAVVIATVTAITCYFKNPSSFPCLRKSGNEASADVEPKV